MIDVNSGYKSSSNNQEQNALASNLEAAAEIARQLRLRDLGGIIIIDFIDMKLPENKKTVYEAMERFMAPDRAKTHHPAHFQVRPDADHPPARETGDHHFRGRRCPACKGTGKIGASMLIVEDIEKEPPVPAQPPA